MKHISFWLAMGLSLAFLVLCDVPVIGAALIWAMLAAWLMCGAVWLVEELR